MPGRPQLEQEESARCSDRDFVESLARGLAVLQAFANQQHQLSIAKISQKTGIARAAVRRYLHTLASLGYVVTPDGQRFALLPKVASLGQVYLSATALPTLAQRHLDILCEQVGEACSLGVLDGVDIVYLARANSSSVLSPRFNVGGRLPAYCTSIGLALLAELPEAVLEERIRSMTFLPYTPRTIASATALRDALARIRADGFAVADQQLEAGFRTIAVAVRNRAGNVVAGINVIVPVARTGLAQMPARYLQPLVEAAATLRTALVQ
jgi:IclR family pca regulon transcriptional regulator